MASIKTGIVKIALVACLVSILASCSIFGSRPRGVISEKQMVRMLTQMHLTEANLRVRNDSLRTYADTVHMRQRFAAIFRDEEVTPEQFRKSLEYYVEHFDELDNIYTEVINNLTEQEALLQKKPADSTKPAVDISKDKPDTRNLPDSIRKRLQNKH